jgi:hypothetical protein
MTELKILIESLSVKQALKFFLLKEKSRHVEDILKIDADLRKMKHIELPEDLNFKCWVGVQ